MRFDARSLLEAVRTELRGSVLPKMDGDYDRSVVIAMLGILGDLAGSVVEDERWIRESVADLTDGARRWAAWLSPSSEAAERIRGLADEASRCEEAPDARRRLLEAAEIAVVTLWGNAELRRAAPEALADVRARIGADVRRQLEARRPSADAKNAMNEKRR